MSGGVATPIQCERLAFAYRGGARATVDLDLRMEPGDLLCLLGPNGAGKTTLIRQILGDLKPSSGQVRVFGLDPVRAGSAVKRRMGVIPQNAALFPTLNVRDHLRTFAALKGLGGPRGREAIDQVVQACGLDDLLPKRGGALSGGQQRRVLFALALLGEPDVLVLDEPTVGLDPEARDAVWSVITAQRDQGRTILLTTHYLEEAERLANRIGFLDGGRLTHEGRVADFFLSLGKSIRLVEGEGATCPGRVHLLDSVGEAEAFARSHSLTSYSIGRVSLQDVYFRLVGRPSPAVADAP